MAKQRARRQILRKYIIVCEGEHPEEDYLIGVRQTRQIQRARVVIHSNSGVPRSVVEKAVSLKKENDTRNRLDGISVEDEIWAVFDRDDHPEIPQAKSIARSKAVNVAFSNPCIELFLLWHFEDCSRDEHRDDIETRLKKHIPDYDKHIDYEGFDFDDRYREAKARAERTNQRSEMVGGIESAPFCSIFELIDKLRSMRAGAHS